MELSMEYLWEINIYIQEYLGFPKWLVSKNMDTGGFLKTWTNQENGFGISLELSMEYVWNYGIFRGNQYLWEYGNNVEVSIRFFFPPQTLMLCDSGGDNQLRVKSPPMIVIIDETKTQTKNNKFRVDDETPGDTRMHGCKMTNAGLNTYECVLSEWIHR